MGHEEGTMSLQDENHVPSAESLDRWIETSGENEFVDAKGPMTWDGADTSASLAKDIAAFANSKDGGIIVIGKSENADGSYSFVGMTPEEAGSFDTTIVGQWINARFAPPIRLACHRAEYRGRPFIVIAIQEFGDIPAICIKSYQEQANPRNHVLREGTVYIRNQNAESKPVMTDDELRTLIGLATRKRGDELLAHFQAMLRGQSLAALGGAPDLYGQEVQQ